MPIKIEDIKKPIVTELEIFEQKFKDSMKSKVPLLDKISHYIIKRKGKQIRPLFVFLSAKAFGSVNDSTYNGASLIELLHTATLVHDDVVDDSFERRGFFSINALWKNKIAVLVGDYLLSRGLLLAINNKEFRILELVSEAVQKMSEGELLQMEKTRKLDIDESVYFDIIRQKTASLISAACATGAASTTKDEEIISTMQQFGEHAGIAFQIKDDLFDFGNHDIGKPKGIDIKEKKMTLPLIHALRNADSFTKRKIKYIIKNQSQDSKKVQEVIDFVVKSDGIKYANEKMNEHKEKAISILAKIPESEAKDSLNLLIHFTINRDK
ncbi:MAG: polyprenyl synthetase family protein [Chitinophagaceae bacterium]|nr:MAG: polyprenyl synthetase family protein [Chitinophagaceae bacterium]